MTWIIAQAASAESFASLGELLKVAAQGSVITGAVVIAWVVFYWVGKQQEAFQQQANRSEERQLEQAREHKEEMARMHADHTTQMNNLMIRHENQIDRVTNDFRTEIKTCTAAVVALGSEVKDLGYKITVSSKDRQP